MARGKPVRGIMARRVRKGRREDRVQLAFLEAVHRRLGDDSDLLKALADLYTRVGRIEDGLSFDLKLSKLNPHEPLVWYNLACSLALVERRDESLGALAQAVRLGYDDFEWMRRDNDLRSLHAEKRFQALLKNRSR